MMFDGGAVPSAVGPGPASACSRSASWLARAAEIQRDPQWIAANRPAPITSGQAATQPKASTSSAAIVHPAQPAFMAGGP